MKIFVIILLIVILILLFLFFIFMLVEPDFVNRIFNPEELNARLCTSSFFAISNYLFYYMENENPAIRVENDLEKSGKKVFINCILDNDNHIRIEEFFCPSTYIDRNFDFDEFNELSNEDKIISLEDVEFDYETWHLSWKFSKWLYYNFLICKGSNKNISNVLKVWEKRSENHVKNKRFVMDWFGRIYSIKDENFKEKIEKDKRKLKELLIDFNKKKKEKIRKKID